MALVDYSDSDDSDTPAKPIAKSNKVSSKPAFQKVVDRANPGRIKVTLPQAALKQDDGEPAPKRPRTSQDGFSGFNSFLPPPKHSGGGAKPTTGSASQPKGRSLGVGVNLKTGAAPGFSRESKAEEDLYLEYKEGVNEETFQKKGSTLSLPPPKALQRAEQKPAEEVKATGKSKMFKPLSVAKKSLKPKKNQVISPATMNTSTQSVPATPEPPPKTKAKVSLFSISAETTGPEIQEYEESSNEDLCLENSTDLLEPSYEDYTPSTSFTSQIPPAVPTPPSISQSTSQSQSLREIASDLNLTPSERRRLFGRNARPDSADPKIITFSTENEYAHNELLRQSQEGQPVHNPVRSIAPGKHSLKQLVGAVQSQKEALEESFSEGKGKRKEAGGRYGW